MSLKGWFLQQGPAALKRHFDEMFVTVSKAGKDKVALDTTPKVARYLSNIASNISAAVFDETTNLWTLTIAGHGAKSYMHVRFTSGLNAGIETPIVSLTTNTISIYGGQSHLDTITAGDDVLFFHLVTMPEDLNATISLSGGATEAKQDTMITALQSLVTNQYLPIQSFARIDFSSTNVTSGAWVQLIADVGSTQIKKMQIFMSSGEPLLIAIGGAGSEDDQGYIIPGGNGFIDLEIPANSRVSVKAVNATTVNTGDLLVNFLG